MCNFHCVMDYNLLYFSAYIKSGDLFLLRSIEVETQLFKVIETLDVLGSEYLIGEDSCGNKICTSKDQVIKIAEGACRI